MFSGDCRREHPLSADSAGAVFGAQKQFAELMRQPPRNGNVVNAPFKVYFRSPEFGLHAIGMSDYLRWGTQYDPKQTELIILLAARQWDSGYIWHAHYALAKKAGMDPNSGGDCSRQAPARDGADQSLLYDLISETYRDHAISDETYDAAAKRFGEKGVTDAIGLAGYYGITAMALIAAKATIRQATNRNWRWWRRCFRNNGQSDFPHRDLLVRHSAVAMLWIGRNRIRYRLGRI